MDMLAAEPYLYAIMEFLFSINCVGSEAQDIETVKASIRDKRKQASIKIRLL